MALTRINNQALTNVTSAGLPSGTVLQVKSTQLSTAFSTSSTSFVDITGFNVSITPSSTSSKIFIMLSVNGYHSDGVSQGEYRVLRGSTDPASISSGRMWVSDGYYGSGTVESAACNFLDSPSTTSATTYKVQIRSRHSSNTLKVGNDWNNDAAGVNTITVMEVAG